MKIVNLIPAKRQASLASAERRRAWYALGGGWALCMLTIYGVAYAWLGVGADPPGVRHQIQMTERQIGEANKSITSLRPAIAELQSHLDTNRSVGRQPDWSLLLSILAAARPEDVVLSGCQLQTPEDVAGSFGPANGAARFAASPMKRNAAAPGEGGDNFVIHLRGYGRSQAAISQYTLRLEKTGLFEKVGLTKENREPYLSSEALAFQLDCTIKLSPTVTTASSAGNAGSAVGEPSAAGNDGRSTP